MDRRRFLKGAGLTLGAGLVTGAAPAPAPAVRTVAAAEPLATASWASIRSQFPLTRDLVQLGGFFLTSHPTPVREAIEAHRKGLDDSPFTYVEENIGRFETAVRAALAKYLAVQPDDFAMTDSTTMGLGLVYGGLELKPDQEVLTTAHDHPSTLWALRFHSQRKNPLKVRSITLYENSREITEEQMVKRVVDELKPETRVVALTWVHSATGVKLPIGRIGQELARVNAKRAEADRALLFVDGVHGFGIDDVTIADLHVDAFMAGCHKWLFGPRGTGFICANAAAWSTMSPTILSFDMIWRKGPIEQLPKNAMMTPGGFHSFEHRWALPAAVDFHLGIGKARIAKRIHELNRQCKEGLAALKQVKVHTPASDSLSAGLVCFNVDGVAPTEVVARLKAKKIVSSESPYSFKCARVSPSLMNTPEDIDALLREVRAMG